MSGERCTRSTLSGDDIECKVAEYFRGVRRDPGRRGGANDRGQKVMQTL